MKKRIIKIIKYVFFFSIGVLLFWLASRKQNFYTIIDDIGNANYFWITLAFMAGFLSHLFRAIRWNMLIDSLGFRTKTHTTLYAVLIGYLTNYVFPRLGEVVRCGVINKQNKVPLNALIGSVVAERVFDTICMMIIMFFVIIFQLDFLGDFASKYMLTPILNKFHNSKNSIFILIVILISALLIGYFILKFLFNKLKKHKFFFKIKRLIVGFIQGLKSIGNVKNLSMFVVHTILIWLMYTTVTYLCFLSFDATSHLTFIDALTLTMIGSIGFIMPVPGGLGAYHFVTKITLVEVFLLSEGKAVSFVHLAYSSQTLLIIVLGFISLFLIFLSGRKQINE